MGNITFVEHDGTEHVVEIEEGSSLMEAAVNNSVPGIDADCGGDCACGTCHVIVEGDFFSKLAGAGDTEQQMLEMTPENESTSRLSCQVKLSEELDGMTVRLPEFQM